MTATPLRDASPAHKLAHLAARRVGKLTDDQRAKLDQRCAALVAEAGDLAEAGIIVTAFYPVGSAADTLSTFEISVQAFEVEPLPAVRAGDDEVDQPIVYKLMRTALDLGIDRLEIAADVDRVIALYRRAFFSAGAGRDLAMVEALPQSILDDVSVLDVIDGYDQRAYEHYFRIYHDHAVNDLPECKKHLAVRSKETQIEDLGDVLAAIALARAGVAEVLGAMFDLGKHGDLIREGEKACGKAEIIRSTAVLEKMVGLLPELPPVNVFSFAETLEDFRHLATPRARPVTAPTEVESLW